MSVEALSSPIVCRPPVEEVVIPKPVAEIAVNNDPVLRRATLDDLDALVRIELDAYNDVYKKPTNETAQELRQKYTERIELLGDTFRVIERPDRGVYGMIVCCPTNLGRDDFMGLVDSKDLTSNETVKSIHDPQGKNAYIVNLAILKEHQGRGESYRLFADAIQTGMQLGVENTYFESRLPGLEDWLRNDPWVQEQNRTAFKIDVPPLTIEEFAEVYWKLGEQRGDDFVPKDPLLKLYARIGARPLRLVKNAWKPDQSSQGFGVLCEFKNPQPEEPLTENAVSEVKSEKMGFIRRALEWAKTHRKGLTLGSLAVGGPAFQATQNNSQEMIDNVLDILPMAGRVYGASWILIIGGAALMLGAVGAKINFSNLIRQPKEEMRALAPLLRHNNLAKTGLAINTLGAVAAASVVGAAVVKALPVAVALAPLSVAVADLFSTVALRYWMYNASKDKGNHIA